MLLFSKFYARNWTSANKGGGGQNLEILTEGTFWISPNKNFKNLLANQNVCLQHWLDCIVYNIKWLWNFCLHLYL